ncbi:MAG: hypothetical protein AAFO17_14805 [Pseudomonadota bacterium]
MTVLSEEERQKVIDAAMKFKFGKLLNWVRPELLHVFGPNDLHDVDFNEDKLRKTIEKVRVEFESWPDGAIQEVADDLNATNASRYSDWSILASQEIDQFHRFGFPPIAFGFGHPSFATDFAYWGSMPKLSLHEVSTLSLGADPDSIKDEDVATLAKKKNKGAKLWSAHAGLLKHHNFFFAILPRYPMGISSGGCSKHQAVD